MKFLPIFCLIDFLELLEDTYHVDRILTWDSLFSMTLYISVNTLRQDIPSESYAMT